MHLNLRQKDRKAANAAVSVGGRCCVRGGCTLIPHIRGLRLVCGHPACPAKSRKRAGILLGSLCPANAFRRRTCVCDACAAGWLCLNARLLLGRAGGGSVMRAISSNRATASSAGSTVSAAGCAMTAGMPRVRRQEVAVWYGTVREVVMNTLRVC